MKTITRIAHSIATRIANSNLNANVTNNSIVKEDTSMNINTSTVSRIARRAAASLLALGGLLTLSHTAKADVEIYRFIPPAQAMFVPAGSTYIEVKVGNTSNYSVSGLQVTIPLNTPGLQQLGGLHDYANVTSEVFSLGPVGSSTQSKWLYIPVPAYGAMGTPFYGMQLTGNVWINDHFFQNVSFQDVTAAANVQATGLMTGQSNVPNGGSSVVNNYALTFTNNGYANAPAQTVTVSMQRYADGNDGAPYTQTLRIPALAVGQSYTVRISSQTTYGDDIRGTVLLNNKVIGTF